jgi:hypothetical protein
MRKKTDSLRIADLALDPKDFMGRVTNVVPLPVNKTLDIEDPSHLIGCPVWWFKAVYPVVCSKAELAIAIYLCRRRITSGKRKTFTVPNGELKSWGISRKVKYRTLDRLAAAGLIKLDRRDGEALTVTILPQPKK